jgi:pterin 4 alpha carbinolamine dehydratase
MDLDPANAIAISTTAKIDSKNLLVAIDRMCAGLPRTVSCSNPRTIFCRKMTGFTFPLTHRSSDCGGTWRVANSKRNERLATWRFAGDSLQTTGHHPDVSFGWGYATVSLSTKKIKGLHENDFIMASKIDRTFAS